MFTTSIAVPLSHLIPGFSGVGFEEVQRVYGPMKLVRTIAQPIAVGQEYPIIYQSPSVLYPALLYQSSTLPTLYPTHALLYQCSTLPNLYTITKLFPTLGSTLPMLLYSTEAHRHPTIISLRLFIIPEFNSRLANIESSPFSGTSCKNTAYL